MAAIKAPPAPRAPILNLQRWNLHAKRPAMYAILGLIGVMSAFVFTSYLYKLMKEMTGRDAILPAPEYLKDAIVPAAICSVLLSIACYAVLMLGIYKSRPVLMLPWLVLTGLKATAGGALIIYLTFYINSEQLLQCLTFYSITVYCFITVFFLYFKVKAIKKIREDKIPIVLTIEG